MTAVTKMRRMRAVQRCKTNSLYRTRLIIPALHAKEDHGAGNNHWNVAMWNVTKRMHLRCFTSRCTSIRSECQATQSSSAQVWRQFLRLLLRVKLRLQFRMGNLKNLLECSCKTFVLTRCRLHAPIILPWPMNSMELQKS